MELDTDSLAKETEGVGKPPKTEKTPMGWEHTNEWDRNEWLGDLSYRYWGGPNEGGIELRREIRVVS